jgi:hypothetical protein
MPKPALPSAVHVLAVVLAGWLNRHQQLAIEYLREENRVLREMLGTRRLRFRAERVNGFETPMVGVQ